MSARQSSARGQRGQSEAAAKDNNGEKSAFSMEGDEMEGYKLSSPIVMKPISQLSGQGRRPSRVVDLPDKFAHNPDDFNPDGSLRTLHSMPKLGDSLKDAKKTRYVRHRDQQEWEKSLSINEIFDKKK